MKPTRTVRDDRGTTRYLDVAPFRSVRWWWDRDQQLWIVETVDNADNSLSYGCAYGQRHYLDKVVAEAAEAIREAPAACTYRHY